MADRRNSPNAPLREFREGQLQMSREEFARLIVTTGREMGEGEVACGPRLIAAWEDGAVGCPRPFYRRILTQLTGRGPAELGFRLPTAPPHDESEDDAVNRRALLRDSAGVVLALPLGFSRRTPGRIGAAEVRSVTAAVHQLYTHDHDHGSAPVRAAAGEALSTAYQWLQSGSYTERTGRKLRSATGALGIAAGWLAFDSGRPADAHSLYGEALAAARIADDTALEAHSFGCLSLLAKASGRPREAISAAQGAQRAAQTCGSPRLLSLMHMREAGGWALLGDRTAADEAIVRAHHLYAEGPTEADPPWLEFFTPAELAGLESLARGDLGQHQRAAAGAEQAVLLHGDTFARNRALYTADIAIHHAVKDRPEPEAAAEAAGRVLTCLRDVRSDRLLRSLHGVASALRRHNRVPAVGHWIEEYRGITADMGGNQA